MSRLSQIILIAFLCAPLFLSGQVDSTSHDTTARPEIFGFHVWTHGRPVNGINIYLGTDPDEPGSGEGSFLVNGLDIAFNGWQRRVNGVAFSFVLSEIDYINGVSVDLLFGDHRAVNGIGLTGLNVFYTDTINGLFISGLGTTAEYGNGIGLSGFWNTYDGKFNGIVGSALYNHMWENVNGIAFTAGMNDFEEDANGLMISGAVTSVEGSANGVIASGAFTKVYEDFHGIAIASLFNGIKGESHGALIGLVNKAAVQQGCQVGLINYTNRLQGLQIGLININNANPRWCQLMPFVNFNFRSLDEMDTIRGKVQGEYIVKSYYSNGKLASIKRFSNGMQHGTQSYYNEFGDLFMEIPYVNGMKNGIAVTYLGGEELLNGTEYHNDSVVGSVEFTRYDTQAELLLIERTSEGPKQFTLVSGSDTLFTYSDGSAFVLLTDVQFHGTLISISTQDTLRKVWWVSATDFGHNDTIQQLYPYKSDTTVVDLGDSDGDQTSDFVSKLNSVLLDNDTSKVLTVLSTFGPDGTRHSIFVRSGVDRRAYVRQSLVLEKNGRVKMTSDKCHGREYYSTGTIKSDVRYKCTNETEYVRRDYYSDGKPAYLEKSDTTIIYSGGGKLLRFDSDSSATTYTNDGQVIYHVTFDSIFYYTRGGWLSMKGIHDTIWRYNKNGVLSRRIEMHENDSVLEINFFDDRIDSSWYGFMYFYSGNGVAERRIIGREPVLQSQALIPYYYEDSWYHNQKCTWYGIEVMRAGAGDGDLYWLSTDLSPVELIYDPENEGDLH